MYNYLPKKTVRRNVFISYHHHDQIAVNQFVQKFGRELEVFNPCMLAEGEKFTNDIINSNDPLYVMSQIRKKHFEHSTVTIVLIGDCTHSRRYIDWEIKASLQQGGISGALPHGLLAINLCKYNKPKILPDRLSNNRNYANFYPYPINKTELHSWIEEAYNARNQKLGLISNGSPIMKYNKKCQICRITH